MSYSPSTSLLAQQREKEALLPCTLDTQLWDAPRATLKLFFPQLCSLHSPKPKSRKQMLGQRANAEIYPCNLKETGGSSRIVASSRISDRSMAWVWQKYDQSLNILFFSMLFSPRTAKPPFRYVWWHHGSKEIQDTQVSCFHCVAHFGSNMLKNNWFRSLIKSTESWLTICFNSVGNW